MFKVKYSFINKNGFLVDRVKRFDVFHEACSFLRDLRVKPKLVGKPIFERNDNDKNV